MAAGKRPSPADPVLENVDASRRGFLRRLIAGAAFAAPVMTSLPLVLGSSSKAAAQTPGS